MQSRVEGESSVSSVNLSRAPESSGDQRSHGEFSVLMAVYHKDNPHFLAEAVESIFSQTLVPGDLVLIGDGPLTDDLRVTVANLQSVYEQLHFEGLPVNRGLACALNFGLKFCRFDLVARMDSDDVCVPNRFEKQFEFMRGNPSLAASSGNILEFGENVDDVISERRLPTNFHDLKRFTRFRSPLNHMAVMFRKSVIESVGAYPEEFKHAQDYALWGKVMAAGHEIGNLPDVLVYARGGQGMLNRRGYTHLQSEIAVVKFLLALNVIPSYAAVLSIFGRLLVRLGPGWLKSFFYTHVR